MNRCTVCGKHTEDFLVVVIPADPVERTKTYDLCADCWKLAKTLIAFEESTKNKESEPLSVAEGVEMLGSYGGKRAVAEILSARARFGQFVTMNEELAIALEIYRLGIIAGKQLK